MKLSLREHDFPSIRVSDLQILILCDHLPVSWDVIVSRGLNIERMNTGGGESKVWVVTI